MTSRTRLSLPTPLQLAGWRWQDPAAAASVVLLHGVTQTSRSWGRVAAGLAPWHQVIAWDARGHGESDWSADADYSTDAHFADLVAALDVLRIRRCALVGFSMGGGVAIMAAAALAERVSHLIVVDAYPDPAMSPGSRQIAEALATHRPHGRPRFDPAISRAMAAELAGDAPRRADLWPFWECAAQPTLIVRGEQSTVLTADMAQQMLAHRPSARLVTLPDIGHPIPARRPATLARLVRAFVTEGHGNAKGPRRR